jgi:hypothetical protein
VRDDRDRVRKQRFQFGGGNDGDGLAPSRGGGRPVLDHDADGAFGGPPVDPVDQAVEWVVVGADGDDDEGKIVFGDHG